MQVVIKDETIWATQKAMAQLFDCSTDNIGLHLKNIFASSELDKDSVTERISATAADGKNYLTTFYSLDAVIAVGYRVSSARATKFRIWATKVLNEFIRKVKTIERRISYVLLQRKPIRTILHRPATEAELYYF